MPRKPYIQKAARQSKKNKHAWLAWFFSYGAKQFLNSFLSNVENAESTCIYCKEKIYVDILIGGGVPDWSTEGGDFGCDRSPDTDSESSGAHMPVKRK